VHDIQGLLTVTGRCDLQAGTIETADHHIAIELIILNQ
jgi:hypothetical protein